MITPNRTEAEELLIELKQFCQFVDDYHEALAMTSIESVLHSVQQAQRSKDAEIARQTGGNYGEGANNSLVANSEKIAAAIRRDGKGGG